VVEQQKSWGTSGEVLGGPGGLWAPGHAHPCSWTPPALVVLPGPRACALALKEREQITSTPGLGGRALGVLGFALCM